LIVSIVIDKALIKALVVPSVFVLLLSISYPRLS